MSSWHYWRKSWWRRWHQGSDSNDNATCNRDKDAQLLWQRRTERMVMVARREEMAAGSDELELKWWRWREERLLMMSIEHEEDKGKRWCSCWEEKKMANWKLMIGGDGSKRRRGVMMMPISCLAQEWDESEIHPEKRRERKESPGKGKMKIKYESGPHFITTKY